MCIINFPALLFYSHIPVLFISFVIAFYIFSIDRKSEVNKNLFIFIIFFIFWMLDSMAQWVVLDKNLNLFLQKIQILEIVSLLFLLFFCHALVGINLSLKKKILLFLPFVPVFLFILSDVNLVLVDEKCTTTEGNLYYYVYLLIMLYTSWSLFILIKKYFSKKIDGKIKNQIRIIFAGIVIFVIWFIIFLRLIDFFAKIGRDDDVSILIPVGMLIFLGMLTYAITKYQLFNIKLIAAQVLVITLVILIGSQFFFIQNNVNKFLTGITLLLSIGFGYMLIKSVRSEVERKEELQDMSTQLARANDQLKKLDNAKSEFISIASHQLRTPLTAIKGFVSLLLEGSYGKMTNVQQDALDKVYQSNERMTKLVEDLLNVSRIESGRMQFTLAKTNMINLCQEVIDTFILRAKEKKMFLDFKKPDYEIPELMVDPTKVREVISNFVDNAIKYTKRGGVTVKISKEGENLRITVSDTGIGIPKSELPYLFGKFSRGKDISRLNAGGTGLGLYVGKNIIETNGGTVWAESDGEGKGSRFIIDLPIQQKKEVLERWS